MTTIPATSGIYRITCTVTGRFYIGSAVNLRERRHGHFNALQRNIHRNPKMQYAFNKYGKDAFVFEVLEFVLIPELLTAREQYWFSTLQPFGDKGYNIARVAGSSLGLRRKLSPEARRKTSIRMLGNTINRGRKLSPERRAQMRQYRHTPETLEKMRQSNTGKKHSPETREKLSQGMIGNKHGVGRKLSPEHIEILRQASIGRKHSPEQNEKQRQAMLGKPGGMFGKTHSPESIEKMRIASTGQYHDPEEHASQMKTLIITFPNGEVQVVRGTKRFCREHNLDLSSLMRVAKGRCKQHKGYKARFP